MILSIKANLRHTKRNICSEKGKGRCPSRVRKRCDCDVERCEGDCQYFACSVQWLSSRPSAPLHDLLIIKSPVFNIACVVDTPTEGKPANCYPKYYPLHCSHEELVCSSFQSVGVVVSPVVQVNKMIHHQQYIFVWCVWPIIRIGRKKQTQWDNRLHSSPHSSRWYSCKQSPQL